MKGVEALAAWIPADWIGALDPGGRVSADELRDAIATAVACLIAALAMRALHGFVRGAGDFSSAGRAHLRAPSALGSLRWLAGMTFALAPAARVFMLVRGDHANDQDTMTAMVAGGLLWALLTAVDHRKVWLEGEPAVLVMRRGLAPFGVQTVRVGLDRGLRDVHRDAPIGAFGGRRQRARLHRDVRRHLEAVIGKAGAERWLRPLLQRDGVVLVHGAADREAS